MLRDKIKLLTKAGKYSDVKKRIKAQQKEIETLNRLLKEEKENINEHKTYLVLDFLRRKELITNFELNKIIKRYRYSGMIKRFSKEADEKLDKKLSGIDKIIHQHKTEINIEELN